MGSTQANRLLSNKNSSGPNIQLGRCSVLPFRWRYSWIILFQSLVIFIICLRDVFGSVPGVEDLEAKAVAGRVALKSGHVICVLKVKEADGRTIEEVVTAIWDGTRIRNDIQRRYLRRPAGAPADSYTEHVCFNDKDYLWYSDEVLLDGHRAAKIEDRKSHSPPSFSEVFDPRMLGLVPTTLQNTRHHGYKSGIIPEGFTERIVSREPLNGTDCWKVVLHKPGGPGNFSSSRKFWIAPSMNFSVLKNEAEVVREKSKNSSDVDCNVVQYKSSDIWFPETLHYVEVDNGKMDRVEDVEVRIVSLNEPIDEKLFDISTMGLSPGVHVFVVGPGVNEQLIWNGAKLIAREGIPSLIAEPPSTDTVRRVSLVITSLICALLAGMLAWKHLKMRAALSK